MAHFFLFHSSRIGHANRLDVRVGSYECSQAYQSPAYMKRSFKCDNPCRASPGGMKLWDSGGVW